MLEMKVALLLTSRWGLMLNFLFVLMFLNLIVFPVCFCKFIHFLVLGLFRRTRKVLNCSRQPLLRPDTQAKLVLFHNIYIYIYTHFVVFFFLVFICGFKRKDIFLLFFKGL